jgi:hypothetical protein
MQPQRLSGTGRFARGCRPFVSGRAARLDVQRCRATAGSSFDTGSRQDAVLAIDHLQKWLSQQEPGSIAKVTPKNFASDFGDRVGLCASKDINPGEVWALAARCLPPSSQQPAHCRHGCEALAAACSL